MDCSTQISELTYITHSSNKAIRDGKYLAPPHASAWQVQPIKIEKFYIFRDVISLLARVFILLIVRARTTQEVPMKNI